MHAFDWLRHSGENPLRSVYVVFGDDAFLIRESINAIARLAFPGQAAEGSITKYVGSHTSLADVMDEVSTLPFFSKRRLVIVEEADPFVSKYRSELEDYAENPSETGILLLQVKRWTASTKLAKIVERVGLAVDCSAPQEAALAPWLIELARTRHGTQLDADAARLVVELAGNEPGILAGEVEKLSVYAGDAKRIEREHVLKLVGTGRVETIWKTVDAATTGHSREALEHLDSLLAGGEDPIAMLAATSATLLKIHHAGRLRTRRMDLDEACRIAAIPSFALEKTRRQHAHLGPRRVDQLPGMLLRADLDLKGGSSLDPRVVLETFIVRLSLSRSD
jgi:DNA polymerase-3 subunit delta